MHAWVYNAQLRLARILSSTDAAKSCANALPVWQAALQSAAQLYPDRWPVLTGLYQEAMQAATCATKAGEASGKAEAQAQQLKQSWAALLADCQQGALKGIRPSSYGQCGGALKAPQRRRAKTGCFNAGGNRAPESSARGLCRG